MDPVPDARLAAALRALHPAPEPAEPDWERLRAAVGARAALPLARRRRAARLRAAARWAGAAVPAAAAAALALHLGGVRPFTERETPALVEEVVQASLPAGELDRVISGSAEREALLLAAVGAAEL